MELSDEVINLLNSTNLTFFDISESMNVLTPVTTIFTVIFIAGVLGNICTCIVIQRNRSMHTATNFYLVSLAILDLLLLIFGLPIEVYRLWYPLFYPLSEMACIGGGIITEFSANATVLTIAAFTVERYFVICRPFISHNIFNPSKALRYIVMIWLFSFLSLIPQAMQYSPLSYNKNVSVCTMEGDDVLLAFVVSSIIFFVTPMSLITVLYVLIGKKLHSSIILKPVKRNLPRSNERSNEITRYRNFVSQRQVIKLLVAVAMSFFICWAPFHVQRVIAVYEKNIEHPTNAFSRVHIVLTYVSGILYFLSTAIKPILYNIMSNKFRHAFKVMINYLLIKDKDHNSMEAYQRLATIMAICILEAAARNGDRITLSRWCSRDIPQLERRYRLVMGTPPQQQNTDKVEQQPDQHQKQCRHYRFTRMPASRVCEPPPRAQSYYRPNFALEIGEPETGWDWKQRLKECSNRFSLQSISNSSLREYDQEFSGEELVTFLYQVNRSLIEDTTTTRDTAV